MKPPIVLQLDHASQFLDYVLQNHAPPTTLIVCSSRANLLRQLIPSVTSATNEQDAVGDGEIDNSTSCRMHYLLHPTLQLLAISKTVKLVFCPELSHLRAQLSIYKAPFFEAGLVPPQAETCMPMLAILDMISLHHGTSQCSAQGFSRTFASAVEAASRERHSLIVCECSDVHDHDNPARGGMLWNTQIPLLSGSIRLWGDGSGWAGRTVTVKRVAKRWFEFRTSEADAVDDLMDVETIMETVAS